MGSNTNMETVLRYNEQVNFMVASAAKNDELAELMTSLLMNAKAIIITFGRGNMQNAIDIMRAL